MGLFDLFSGSKKPPAGTPVLSADEVRARLAGLNRETAPWRIVDGSAEKVDFIAEWKIVDAQWHEIFGKAGLSKVFRIKMRLDPARHEVRAMDEENTVSWSAGVPAVKLAVSSFKGQQTTVEFGAAVAFTEEAGPGVVYKYKFATGEIKKPIQEAINACGWVYKGVAFGKL